MPFLRFTRDKRGYETTSLVHALRGRHGRERQKLLYWFRTPPGVKVGRPALDEEAIRWIEEHNPEIDFDWQKILEATPPPAPQAEDAKSRRVRRGKTERRAPGPQPSPQQPQPPSVAVTATPESPSAQEQDEEGAIATIGEAVQREELDGRPAEDDAGVEGVADDDAPEAQAFEQLTHADAEELPAAAQAAVQTLVGYEQLVRLRARYAELQARITERGSDAAQIEALRGRAEPLNPDSWVTADEVKKGLEEFETALRDLRAELGLRRRRRSRRGGRRRRGGGTGQEAQTPAPAADSPSNSPDDAPDDTET